MVSIDAISPISLGENMVICEGEEVTISASGAGVISWDNDLGTGNEVVVSPLEDTFYTATLTNAEGCTDSGQIMVEVNPYPLVDAGEDQEECEGYEITLNAVGNGTLSWDNGIGEVTSPTLVLEETTVFTLTASFNGCEATDEVLVTAL